MGSTIVTLTTDWGYSDFFAGSVKGKLLSYIPGVQVVDITHGILQYQIIRATFVVKQCCFDFPAGTIHIIDVCSSQTTEHPFVVVECNGHLLICTDNGLPAAAFAGRDYRAVVIDGIRLDTDSQNFAARDLFCKVAALLAQGTPLEELGFPADALCPSTPIITTAAANYINSRHYQEALNVLDNIEDHSAVWYYYSAVAHAGMGDHAQALDHARTAASMEPDNYTYQNLVTQLQSGTRWYQEQQKGYVQTYDSGQWCVRLCLLNIALNMCCGGGGLCCGRYPY